MADTNDLVRLIKRAALDAVDAGKPVNVCFGRVTKASPLVICVDQKLYLGENQLVLCRSVTEYTVQVKVEWETDSGFDQITGDKYMLVRNALKTGDEVLLLRVQDGQKYVVVDRI